MGNETIYISDQVVGLDELVDHRVAGKILGLRPRAVQNMTAMKKLPFYKISSRCNRYLVRELVEWCEQKRVAA